MSLGANKKLFVVTKKYEAKKNETGRKNVKFVVQHNCQKDPNPVDYSIEIESSFGNISNDINENRFNEEQQSIENMNYPQTPNDIKDEQINSKLI